MKTRKIGDFTVGQVGLGCMNLSHAYGVPPAPEVGAIINQETISGARYIAATQAEIDTENFPG